MCFSAGASFTAAILLSVIGIVGYRMAYKKKEYLIALSPVLFALQQCFEGILWLTLPDYAHTLISRLAIYAFLSFALVIWPLWIPTTLFVAESDSVRKAILKKLIACGALTALIFSVYVIRNGVDIQVSARNIQYTIGVPDTLSFLVITSSLYLLSTVLPFFISSLPYMSIVGIILIISYAITYTFYYTALISVWCFFAAIISSSILLVLYKKYYTAHK